MSQLEADIPRPLPHDVFDPSPLRQPFLTPQSDWTVHGVNETRYMQRTLFLGFTKFKITSREPRGRAELLRMLFHYAGIPFEDETLSDTDWKSLMCKTPYGNLPVLWMDHQVYGEMNVIVRHLARHLVMMGYSEKEQLLAETVFQQVQDLKESDVMQKAFEELQERADDNVEQVFEVMLPEAFTEWESYIRSSKGLYILPSGISVVDMAIYDFISQYSEYLPIDNVLSGFPTLQDHNFNIAKHPRLQTYFKKKPVKCKRVKIDA